MTVRDADGNRMSKTEVLATLTEQTPADQPYVAGADLYRTYTLPGVGNGYDATQALVVKAGHIIHQSDIDRLFMAPEFDSILPTSGTDLGGLPVVIRGDHFGGATGVTFGGEAGTDFTIVSEQMITVTTPDHVAGVVDVVVADDSGDATYADAFTYTSTLATVTLINPASGDVAGGTVVTITGTNLDGVTAVEFGGTEGTSLSVAEGGLSLTVTTPAHLVGVVDVVLTDSGRTVTETGGFEYTSA